jgi:ADP-heptose:LPS heptosyltransferase
MENIEKLFKRVFIRCLSTFVQSQRTSSLEKTQVRSILVIRQHDQLGDMLCCVPLLRAVREYFPKAHITLVASPVSFEIMRNHPYIDAVLNYGKNKFLTSPRSFWKFIREFRQRKYDVVIVPATVSVSLTSDVLALVSRARVRIGPNSLQQNQNPAAFCYTIPVDLNWSNDPRRHQAKRNLDIVAPLGIQANDLNWRIGLTSDEQKEADGYVAEYRRKYKYLVGFHPGAGKPENRWNANRFANVANKICSEFNAMVFVTSGPMDTDPLNEIQQHLKCKFVIIHNQPIRKVAAIIDLLDLFITNDTGIMHVAGATKTNMLALFGPTDPLQWAPTGTKNRYISSRDGRMESISEDEVYDVASLILSQTRK